MSTTRQEGKGLVRIPYTIDRVLYVWNSPISGKNGECKTEVFIEVADRIVAWMSKKTPFPIPNSKTLLAESWDHEAGMAVVKSVALPANHTWALKFKHADTQVPNRAWTTELYLSAQDRTCKFAIRLTCSGPYDVAWSAETSVPAIVKTLASYFNMGLVRMHLDPQKVATELDVRQLHAYLDVADRDMPVVVITEWEHSRRPDLALPQFVFEPDKLAKYLAGLAEIYYVPIEMRDTCIDVFDKEWTTFGGGVRLYYPGLSWDDYLSDHPLVILDRILDFQYDEKKGPEAYKTFLKDRLVQYNVSRARKTHFPTVQFIQQKISEYARSQNLGEGEYQILLEKEIEDLKETVSRKEENEYGWLQENEQLKNEITYLKDELFNLRAHNESLLAGRRRVAVINPMDTAPKHYSDVAYWVSQVFSKTVELHPRARRALKDACYNDISLVCSCIHALGTYYVEMKTGNQQARHDWEEFLAHKLVENSRSISESRLGEEGVTYLVDYQGAKRELEWHLKKGTSKDARDSMRIYFFYDDVSKKVVIGWLTSHLDTRAT